MVLSAKRRFKAPKVAGVSKKRPPVSSLCHLLQLNRQIQARCQLKGERTPPGTERHTQ